MLSVSDQKGQTMPRTEDGYVTEDGPTMEDYLYAMSRPDYDPYYDDPEG